MKRPEVPPKAQLAAQPPGVRIKASRGCKICLYIIPLKDGEVRVETPDEMNFVIPRLDAAIEADPFDLNSWDARLREAIQDTGGRVRYLCRYTPHLGNLRGGQSGAGLRAGRDTAAVCSSHLGGLCRMVRDAGTKLSWMSEVSVRGLQPDGDCRTLQRLWGCTAGVYSKCGGLSTWQMPASNSKSPQFALTTGRIWTFGCLS